MVIIGAGRVGTALQLAAESHDMPCALVSRTEGWEALGGPPGGPVMLATRNDDLDSVVERIPPHRQADLVFVQNGMLQPWVRGRGLQGCTRGLLFFAATARNEPHQPGQSSPFSGPRASVVVHWLLSVGVAAHEVDWPRFKAWELEKLIWIAAFGVLCQAHECDVQTVVHDHTEQLDALVDELRQLGRSGMNVDVPQEWLVQRLSAYSLTIPTYRGSVKEWAWRNGWFVDVAKRRGKSSPVHDALLREIGLGDKLV
ncbi:MAG: ketopantoate reductase [Kiritimatiellia bacterium]|jgi:ketopantoate reductase